jgi:hypothetical protein
MSTTSTEHVNVERVRRGYRAFNAADVETLVELIDENATWQTPGRSSIGGAYVGRDAILGHFGQYGADTDGTFRAELLAVTADDDGNAVGIHHNKGERNGKRLDVLCCIAFEVEDGRVVSGREHFYDLHAWDEFWS